MENVIITRRDLKAVGYSKDTFFKWLRYCEVFKRDEIVESFDYGYYKTSLSLSQQRIREVFFYLLFDVDLKLFNKDDDKLAFKNALIKVLAKHL